MVADQLAVACGGRAARRAVVSGGGIKPATGTFIVALRQQLRGERQVLQGMQGVTGRSKIRPVPADIDLPEPHVNALRAGTADGGKQRLTGLLPAGVAVAGTFDIERPRPRAMFAAQVRPAFGLCDGPQQSGGTR